MTNILVLDPATSTGWCVVNVTTDRANICKEGYIQVDISSDYQGDHCIDLMKQLLTMILEHKITTIVVEDYFFSRKTATGSNVNAAFRTAIHILARQNNIPYYIVNISAWKTFVAGKSRPNKEQKKKWGKISQKLYIQEALWTKYKFRFPNHSISEKTGKPINFRNDIVDVVGQAVYYCGLVLGIRNITRTVETPTDVKITKAQAKKVFDYDAIVEPQIPVILVTPGVRLAVRKPRRKKVVPVVEDDE